MLHSEPPQHDLLPTVVALRGQYRRLAAALPWLDACRCEEDPPAFGAYADDLHLPAAPRVRAALDPLPAPGRLAVYEPLLSPPLAELAPVCAARGVPLVVRHTDVPPEAAGALAAAHTGLDLVVESGSVKLLYYLDALEQQLLAHERLYLCTYNLCNWQGLERLCGAGLGRRLLFGTHAPRYSAAVARGPIVMSSLPWEQRCDLAGNNLRRLLGLPPASVPAPPAWQPPEPFIIDSHGHNGPVGRFHTPDEQFAPSDWLQALDDCGLQRLYLTPTAAIADPEANARAAAAGLLAAAPDRFRYYTVFHPAAPRDLAPELGDPLCAGIKIHPVEHRAAADDPAYAAAFAQAQAAGCPLLTHSWEASPTNPVQHLSLPQRFESHLRQYPETRLILGHAGGRPSTAETVVELCGRYRAVYVDLAGDYFDSGLVAMLCARLGAERVLFASDVNWFDPRCMLAAVLEAGISDAEALQSLRATALELFG